MGGILPGEKTNSVGVALPRDAEHGLRLPLERDGGVIDDKEPGLVQAYIGAQVPCEQGVLLGGVVAEKQDGRRGLRVAQPGLPLAMSGERADKGGVVRGAVVIDVVGSEHGAGKLLQQVILFIGRAIGADHPDRLAAAALANLPQPDTGTLERLLPAGFGKLSIRAANERLGDPFGMIGKVKTVAPLDAEKAAVEAASVPVVAAQNLRSAGHAAHPERGLAAIAAVGADGRDVVHLPGPRLVAVSAGGKRADGADVDAHTAFLALQMILLVGHDHARDAAVFNAQGPDIHAFAAHANAAVAENAARPVEVNHRRPLLLFAMLLGLGIQRLARAVFEGHVLQLAFAAGVAHRAIERMIPQEQLDCALARLHDLGALGRDDHARGHRRRAGGLELRHLLQAHQAHAAGGLQRKPGIVTELRNRNARGPAGLDEQSARGRGQRLAVNDKAYVGHPVSLVLSIRRLAPLQSLLKSWRVEESLLHDRAWITSGAQSLL